MFKLTEDELDTAKAVIDHHGYGVYFPEPPEWETLTNNWSAIRRELAGRDLDIYQPSEPLKTFAPKSRINIRPVMLLHPYDLLIYTGLTMIVRNDIESARVKRTKRMVFSHRSTPALSDALYEPPSAAHLEYRTQLRARASKSSCKAVAVTDIADFFPRVYQHRLQNIIRTVASTPRATDVARVLVDKFLLSIAYGDSYGIPVGPLASGVLAEAVLIDVDAALIDEGFSFVRWFDDFTFFCSKEGDAQRALFVLGRWLYLNHGLTLQPAKTRIFSKVSYLKGLSRDYEERIKQRSEALHAWWIEAQGDYASESDITDEIKDELEKVNLADLLTEAIERTDGVDFEFAELILGRIAVKALSNKAARELATVVVKHIPNLYPVIASVGSFLSNIRGLSESSRKRIAKALLAPLLKEPQPPEFVAMWVLHVLATSPKWNNAHILRRVYVEATSPVVKRYAALALAINGGRNEALSTRDDLVGAKPLVRTAILRVWRKLGSDERTHLRRMSVIADPLEKVI